MESKVLSRLPAVVVLVWVLSGAAITRAQDTDPVVDALVKFKEDMELPAREPGVLVRLTVEEGDKVQKGQPIGLVDDSEPRMQKEVAYYALEAAKKRATDDVEIRYAEKQAAVAEKDYEKLIETNQRAPGAVSQVEVRRAKLDWDRALLSIEKAGHDRELAKYEAYTKRAELKAADLAINRRTVVAPFDGEVVEIHREQDEWVNPGDAILRLVRRDVMHVEGAVDQSKFDPDELQGCDVSVAVELARGRTETVDGRIVYVSPVRRYDGMYNVRAEVANRQNELGRWILMDGQAAKMTIHVQTVRPTAEVSRKP